MITIGAVALNETGLSGQFVKAEKGNLKDEPLSSLLEFHNLAQTKVFLLF